MTFDSAMRKHLPRPGSTEAEYAAWWERMGSTHIPANGGSVMLFSRGCLGGGGPDDETWWFSASPEVRAKLRRHGVRLPLAVKLRGIFWNRTLGTVPTLGNFRHPRTGMYAISPLPGDESGRLTRAWAQRDEVGILLGVPFLPFIGGSPMKRVTKLGPRTMSLVERAVAPLGPLRERVRSAILQLLMRHAGEPLVSLDFDARREPDFIGWHINLWKRLGQSSIDHVSEERVLVPEEHIPARFRWGGGGKIDFVAGKVESFRAGGVYAVGGVEIGRSPGGGRGFGGGRGGGFRGGPRRGGGGFRHHPGRGGRYPRGGGGWVGPYPWGWPGYWPYPSPYELEPSDDRDEDDRDDDPRNLVGERDLDTPSGRRTDSVGLEEYGSEAVLPFPPPSLRGRIRSGNLSLGDHVDGWEVTRLRTERDVSQCAETPGSWGSDACAIALGGKMLQISFAPSAGSDARGRSTGRAAGATRDVQVRLTS